MPKRVLDFDALWASDKLASCAEWAQSEYAWLYGLADASGSFEITNLRVVWGRVAAIRKNLTLERLQQIFDEFIACGLLFIWEENGKRYGHWTGSDVPGRLPPPSWRARLEKLAPPVPRAGLAAYSARFGGSKEGIVTRPGAGANSRLPVPNDGHPSGLKPEVGKEQAELKHGLEKAQVQDWDLDWEKDLEKEASSPAEPSAAIADRTSRMHAEPHEITAAEDAPEALLEIYGQERGELPPAGAMTPQRRLRCERCLASGLTPEEFRAAVRRAAVTPFLTGDGDRGWQASFDWLVANRSNVHKVLGGEYDPQRRGQARESRPERRAIADLYAGIGPRAADCGVRVNPAALERILARHAELQTRDLPPAQAQDEGARETPHERIGTRRSAGATQAHVLAGAQLNSTAGKPVVCDAQARASPKTMKF